MLTVGYLIGGKPVGVRQTVEALLGKLQSGTLVPGLAPFVSVTLTNQTPGAYSPSTGDVAMTSAPVATVAIPRSLTLNEVARSGGTLRVGDIEFKFRDVEPKIGGLVAYGGRTFRIFSVAPIQLEGYNLLYVAFARGEG